jgi:hypothetical protein
LLDAAQSLHPSQGTTSNLVFQLRYDLADGRMNRVITALGNNVRTRCDQVDADAEGRTFFVPAFQADIRFVNLQPGLQGDDPFFDEGVQFLSGPQVMMLHGELHDVLQCGVIE